MTSGIAEPRRAQIGPYRLLAKIGEGGMGTVHLAKMDGPAGFNKLAVVKELRSDRVNTPQFAQMFLDEARLAARLTHANVVHTYGANEEQGRLFLAMEYLDGQPWSRIRRALWERGSLPLELHIKVLAETLAGLHYAHELRDFDNTPLRVVHCDMSPQNVFVTYDGQVKLVDFGVARGVTRTTRPDPNVIMGKLAFIAPEQARGDEVDRRADIFSVGVMLWEALARRRFAEGNDWAELRKRRVEGTEPRACELGPSVPAALAGICDRALALDPNARYATAADFREALLSFSPIDIQDAERAQLGDLVSQAFSDDRTRIHALIERACKPPERKSGIEALAALLPHNQQQDEPVEHTVRADLTELASVSRIHNEADVIEAVSGAQLRFLRRRQHPELWLSAGAALFVAATWFMLRSPGVAPTTTNAITATPLPPARIDPAPPAPPPMAANIQLVVAATPADTVLTLDGAPLGKNPYAGRVPSDSALHVIRAEAHGQVSQERVLTFEGDRALSFSLSPQPRVARARKPAPAAAGSSSFLPSASAVDASVPARVGEPIAPAARPRQRALDAFDAPLHTETGSRPIYAEDPYR